jgi:RNA polymerase sigma-70 factor, ECF subfamily
MYSTSASLLERLKLPGDHVAWERFVQIYTPFLYYCAKQARLGDADAADVVQDVFVHLMDKMLTFEYRRSGSFRGWLKTVTLNKCRERHRRRRETATGEADVDQSVEDEALNRFWETEYTDIVVARALKLMQTEFETTTWQACWQHVVEDRPAAEVAENLGLSLPAVYTYSSRVLKRLRQELRDLME